MVAAARWLGGMAACSGVVGSRGADTNIYKFTTISDMVCRGDHDGALHMYCLLPCYHQALTTAAGCLAAM